jgi:hypothetical protein
MKQSSSPSVEKSGQAATDSEDKAIDNFVETATMHEKDAVAQGGDYSGAVKKTSEEEIRLVRKLDWRIMPTLWAMYFLNYVSLQMSSIPRSRSRS